MTSAGAKQVWVREQIELQEVFSKWRKNTSKALVFEVSLLGPAFGSLLVNYEVKISHWRGNINRIFKLRQT